jgi:hypothetical protein
MKPLCVVLAVVLALFLVTAGECLGEGEGRYQAITIFRGSTPMVFILDTSKGHSWLWQKGSYTNEAGVREEWSAIYYQGNMAVGRETGPGQRLSAPRWRLPDGK